MTCKAIFLTILIQQTSAKPWCLIQQSEWYGNPFADATVSFQCDPMFRLWMFSVLIILFIILQSCCSLQEHCGPDQRRQPYILAVGTTRNSIQEYYIAMDGELLPCKARSSLPAFDELFKAHYVFGISYDQALNTMYTFVQTTIYNIDIGLSHETPRVKDLRAKLLNWCCDV